MRKYLILLLSMLMFVGVKPCFGQTEEVYDLTQRIQKKLIITEYYVEGGLGFKEYVGSDLKKKILDSKDVDLLIKMLSYENTTVNAKIYIIGLFSGLSYNGGLYDGKKELNKAFINHIRDKESKSQAQITIKNLINFRPQFIKILYGVLKNTAYDYLKLKIADNLIKLGEDKQQFVELYENYASGKNKNIWDLTGTTNFIDDCDVEFDFKGFLLNKSIDDCHKEDIIQGGVEFLRDEAFGRLLESDVNIALNVYKKLLKEEKYISKCNKDKFRSRIRIKWNNEILYHEKKHNIKLLNDDEKNSFDEGLNLKGLKENYKLWMPDKVASYCLEQAAKSIDTKIFRKFMLKTGSSWRHLVLNSLKLRISALF